MLANSSLSRLRLQPLAFATLSALLTMTALISSARAETAYDDEVCSAKLAPGRVNFFSRTHENLVVLQGKQDNYDIRAIYADKKSGAKELPSRDDDLVLNVVREDRKKKDPYDDGCFKGQSGTFRREVKVTRASLKARELLGIKREQTLKLVCNWEAIVPTDACLDKGGY